MTGIKRYTNADYPLLQDWYEARKSKCPPRASLSDMGWIADGRVAGFLYITPSDVCIIEGIVADPNTIPSLRQESLHKLSGFLVDWAIALGYKNIVAITEHPSISTVCERLGFRELGHRVFTLRTE